MCRKNTLEIKALFKLSRLAYIVRKRTVYTKRCVSCMFDAELVQNVINKMKRGKAGGLDGITIEHIQFSHYLLPCILAKLFNVITGCAVAQALC